jgi:sugar-specific transcriptional regulator TrmB
VGLDLYGDETKVVNYLKNLGLADGAARIYTAVLCRQYRAPRDELVSAVKYHLPGTHGPSSGDESVSNVIDDLIKRSLFREVRGLNEVAVEAESPWLDALSVLANPEVVDEKIAAIIKESLRAFADSSPRERGLIERLGWATWEKPRQSWRDAIGQAKHRVRLGVYSSITVYDEIKDEIRQAFVNHRQMEVQILMFSPEVAAEIESNPDLANDVRKRTKDWLKLFAEAKKEAGEKGHTPKLEIRHIQDPKMSGFHRVALIDERLWMLNIHRPGIERGIEGIVYQGVADGRKSNIHDILEHYWANAWEQARDVRVAGRIFYELRRYGHLVVIVLMPAFAWYVVRNKIQWWDIKEDAWSGAAIGLMMAELYNSRSILAHAVSRLFGAISALFRPAGKNNDKN